MLLMAWFNESRVPRLRGDIARVCTCTGHRCWCIEEARTRSIRYVRAQIPFNWTLILIQLSCYIALPRVLMKAFESVRSSLWQKEVGHSLTSCLSLMFVCRTYEHTTNCNIWIQWPRRLSGSQSLEFTQLPAQDLCLLCQTHSTWPSLRRTYRWLYGKINRGNLAPDRSAWGL